MFVEMKRGRKLTVKTPQSHPFDCCGIASYENSRNNTLAIERIGRSSGEEGRRRRVTYEIPIISPFT